jgi:hypothetical protein
MPQAAVAAVKKKPNKYIQMVSAKSKNCKTGSVATQKTLDRAIEAYEKNAASKGKTSKEITAITKSFKSKSCAAVSGIRKKTTTTQKKY